MNSKHVLTAHIVRHGDELPSSHPNDEYRDDGAQPVTEALLKWLNNLPKKYFGIYCEACEYKIRLPQRVYSLDMAEGIRVRHLTYVHHTEMKHGSVMIDPFAYDDFENKVLNG